MRRQLSHQRIGLVGDVHRVVHADRARDQCGARHEQRRPSPARTDRAQQRDADRDAERRAAGVLNVPLLTYLLTYLHT